MDVLRFVHVPLQLVSGGAQATAQTPSAQISPARQACPQLPQLELSVSMLVVHPVDEPVQFAQPELHEKIAQAPATH